ncbi:MAG TPA: alpha/beta hydrolase [Candidatus Binatia bacterium]|nr:alpha/beta hydrolase [Candidatus Binatia bacterium]
MRRVSRDGVALCYEAVGAGAPALLFVHGWCCDHTYFAPQVDYFLRTHRIVAVDLRGHGESDKPQQDYTMPAFADDLAWLCEQLRVERPVVVGHSMGGVIALALAARHPYVPAAIVTVDSPILAPAAIVEAISPFLAALRSPQFREAQRMFVSDRLFHPDDDPARKARITEAMAQAPQHVMASAFENIFAFDHAQAAAACKIPWLALYAADPISDLVRLRQLCPQLVVGQTVGAGHFHQLEVPEQVNAMIARFLRVSLPS